MGQGSAGAAIFPAESRSGYPNYYYATGDIDPSLREGARARRRGGRQGAGPGPRLVAACKDSEGNVFHLWQQDESAS
jgi:predicted enzyme related to lactoylglutathione lyase